MSEVNEAENESSLGWPRGWRRVADDLPPDGQRVLVCYLGELAVGVRKGSFPMPGLHEWLVYVPGGHLVAPYTHHAPRWWMPIPPLPEPRPVGIHAPLLEGGEKVVRWRGSTSDLATDLKEVLSIDEAERVCVELLAKYERDIREEAGDQAQENRPWEAKLDANAAYGKHGTNAFRSPPAASSQQPASSGEPPPPIPLLLWCPECNERHVDRGEFATKVHHTHECQFCGHTWRPAVVATRGVQFLFRKPDAEPEVSTRASAIAGRDPGEDRDLDRPWPSRCPQRTF